MTDYLHKREKKEVNPYDEIIYTLGKILKTNDTVKNIGIFDQVMTSM